MAKYDIEALVRDLFENEVVTSKEYKKQSLMFFYLKWKKKLLKRILK